MFKGGDQSDFHKNELREDYGVPTLDEPQILMRKPGLYNKLSGKLKNEVAVVLQNNKYFISEFIEYILKLQHIITLSKILYT